MSDHQNFDFRVVKPIDFDADVLVVKRLTWNDDGKLIRVEMLTEEGWEQFPPNSYLPLHRFPRMTGAERFQRAEVDAKLVAWEHTMRQVINETFDQLKTQQEIPEVTEGEE